MSVELPGHTERMRRIEDGKDAHEEERRFKGESAFLAPSSAEPDDLRAALHALVCLMLPCRVCGSAGPPATRKVFGTVEARAGRQSAEVVLCDGCDPPEDTPFARYQWGLPYDLPHAGPLRFLLRHLDALETGKRT